MRQVRQEDLIRELELKDDDNLRRQLKNALLEYMTNNNDYLKIKEENKILYNNKDYRYLNDEYDYLIKDYKLIDDGKDRNREIKRQSNTIRREESVSEEEMFRKIQEFLSDGRSVLQITSPTYLRGNENVIVESLRRDINSIDFVEVFSERVKQVAIEEAIRQNYAVNYNTNKFLLESPEFIKFSLDKDINSIRFFNTNNWSLELKSYAISKVLSTSEYELTSASPMFLLTNFDVVKKSIELNPKLINELPRTLIFRSFSLEQIREFINIIVNSPGEYWLSSSSPDFLKTNIDVILKSIKHNPDSVVYVKYEPETINEYRKRVIDLLLESNYVFKHDTPPYLLANLKLCLNSVKQDISSGIYISQEFIDENIELKRYLITHDFYSLEEFGKLSITTLKDEEILEYFLKKMALKKDEEQEFQDSNIIFNRAKEFIAGILNKKVSVTNIRNIFHMAALKEWEKYRQENYDYYTNIFNRICDSLEQNNNFIAAITELKFLLKVDDVLDERKYELFNAFIEYHMIYHNPKIKDKMELLAQKRDDISKNASLFIAKSKEDFISEKIKEYADVYKKYFIIKIDNPIVRKKVVEIKQREELRKRFIEQNPDLYQKLGNIKNKWLMYQYHESINREKIDGMINLFITQIIDKNVFSIDDVLNIKPKRFDEYEVYEKVSKIINRLNSHNISFDSKEVNKYRHLIEFDGEKYIYSGESFDEQELYQINGYKDLRYVFGKVKSEILQVAKSIDSFASITQEDIKEVMKDCPFTEEFYEFNLESLNMWYVNKIKDILKVFDDNSRVISDDKNYAILKNLLVDNGLYQLALFNDLGSGNYLNNQPNNSYQLFSSISSLGVSDIHLNSIIENIASLREFMGEDNLTIENFDKIIDYNEMFKYAGLMEMSILGKDTLKKIYSNNGFTSSSQAKRIEVACSLVSIMARRKESTVPYINGKYGNYRYSMYDSVDETILTSGLDTNACFRVCGNDNDFLHYCVLDKNGFVIKLTDNEGNFIGRASGFRNGNGVYINQLRTIYDKKSSAYDSEKKVIIEAFNRACQDIVNISQNNENETNKIDFVVVTKSYSLENTPSNVETDVTSFIGVNPMDTQSEDWKNFKSTTPNLNESKAFNYFDTDFGNYNLICMASAVGKLTKDKIKKGDVPAVYKRKRSNIEVKNSSEEVEKLVNKVRAISYSGSNNSFRYLKLPVDSQVLMGDNWYIAFNKNGILDSGYIKEDVIAEVEYTEAMNNIMNSIQNLEALNVRTSRTGR